MGKKIAGFPVFFVAKNFNDKCLVTQLLFFLGMGHYFFLIFAQCWIIGIFKS